MHLNQSLESAESQAWAISHLVLQESHEKDPIIIRNFQTRRLTVTGSVSKVTWLVCEGGPIGKQGQRHWDLCPPHSPLQACGGTAVPHTVPGLVSTPDTRQ